MYNASLLCTLLLYRVFSSSLPSVVGRFFFSVEHYSFLASIAEYISSLLMSSLPGHFYSALSIFLVCRVFLLCQVATMLCREEIWANRGPIELDAFHIKHVGVGTFSPCHFQMGFHQVRLRSDLPVFDTV